MPQGNNPLMRLICQVALVVCLAIVAGVMPKHAHGLYQPVHEPYVLPMLPPHHSLGKYLALSGDGSTLASKAMVEEFTKTISVFHKDPETQEWSLQAELQLPTHIQSRVDISHDGNMIVAVARYNQGRVFVFTRSDGTWTLAQTIETPPPTRFPAITFARNFILSSDASTLILCLGYGTSETNVGPLVVYNRTGNDWTFEGYVFAHWSAHCVTPDYSSMAISPDGNTLMAVIETFELPSDHRYTIRGYRRTSPGVWVQYDVPIEGTTDEYYGEEFQIRALVKNGQYAFVTLRNVGILNVLHRNDEQATFDLVVANTNVTFEGKTDFYLPDLQRLIVNEQMTTMLVSKEQGVIDFMSGKVEGISIAYSVKESLDDNSVDFSSVYQVLRAQTDDEDVLDRFGSSAAFSEDASTLVIASADYYSPTSIFFYERDGATLTPSQAPTTNKCRRPARPNKAQCKAAIKRCPQANLKWLQKGCNASDRGCKCKGFCNHRCKKGCNADPYCKWKNGRCFDKKTNTLWGINNC